MCYRCVSFGTRREGEEKAPNRGQFLVAATLGWLFEVGMLKSLMSVIKLFVLLLLRYQTHRLVFSLSRPNPAVVHPSHSQPIRSVWWVDWIQLWVWNYFKTFCFGSGFSGCHYNWAAVRMLSVPGYAIQASTVYPLHRCCNFLTQVNSALCLPSSLLVCSQKPVRFSHVSCPIPDISRSHSQPLLGDMGMRLELVWVKFTTPDAGPIRKIKPVSADIDHSETTPAKQLQVRSLIKSIIVSIKCYRWAEPITFGGQLCDWEVAIQLTFCLDRSSLYFAVVDSNNTVSLYLTQLYCSQTRLLSSGSKHYWVY